MNYSATNYIDHNIIFRITMDIKNNFLHAKSFHGCNNKNLEHILKLTSKLKFTTNEVNLDIER